MTWRPAVHTGGVRDLDADDRELRSLRERVYGPASSLPASHVDLERLRQLERERIVSSLSSEEDVPDAVSTAHSADSARQAADPHRPSVRERQAPEPPRRAWRARSIVVAGGVLLVIIGYAWGATATVPHISGPLPEFDRAQTGEDRLPVAATAGVIPASSRFVARVDGFDVFLARQDGGQGVCVVSYLAGTNQAFLSTTCGSGSGGGLLAPVTRNLDVAIGDLESPPPDGDALRLSESVTAYRR
ncbi:hypothetical protein SAMN04487846_2850 [Microbacterium sp. cf046]|uniref:hypothetical protein n=1 Tax=Microbacterium sp. cf046 TaxID=1761803 RepID=UPI0008E4AFAF|nr:hypothetical protein [Microbacterium sp. cf046]SFS14112.1 hypothetical protein SAMN04487846_2850 [Microbacterium sp. cf046]